MTVSKRTRFEVLKRDNHTCRYCGGKAPDVVLTVDHVTPVALGGSDDSSNLVAACKDCNAGKSSTTPSDELVAQVGEDDIRWADAVKRAADQLEKQLAGDRNRNQWFVDAWKSWDSELAFLPRDWERSVDHWIAGGLTHDLLIECHEVAFRNRSVHNDRVFAYMGGIARNRIEDLHEAARALLDAEETPD